MVSKQLKLFMKKYIKNLNLQQRLFRKQQLVAISNLSFKNKMYRTFLE